MPSPWQPSGVVTLASDFGTAGPYVAAMKGVLLREAPELRAIVDVSHEIPPQDLVAAALVLEAAWSWFPVGTVHLVVVDPEVGTERAILLASCDGHVLVAPDNGVLAPLIDGAIDAVVHAVDPEAVPYVGPSATFHGRDRFAPLVARLATGAAPAELGSTFTEWRRLSIPAAVPGPDGSLRAEVLTVDRFGNLITSVTRTQLGEASWRGEIAGRSMRLVRTYGEAAPGELVCLVDSHERVEVAVRNGDASRELALGRGAEVRMFLEDATEAAR